jgi:hypothetical protein
VGSPPRKFAIGGVILGVIVILALAGLLQEPRPAGAEVCHTLVELEIPSPKEAAHTSFREIHRRFRRIAFEVDDLAPHVDDRALRSKARAFARTVRTSEAGNTVALVLGAKTSILQLLDACDDAGFVEH